MGSGGSSFCMTLVLMGDWVHGAREGWSRLDGTIDCDVLLRAGAWPQGDVMLGAKLKAEDVEIHEDTDGRVAPPLKAGDYVLVQGVRLIVLDYNHRNRGYSAVLYSDRQPMAQGIGVNAKAALRHLSTQAKAKDWYAHIQRLL